MARGADAGRSRTLIRALRLLRELQAGKRDTLAGFASRHGVCCRTVRRDMGALEAAGYPVCRAPDSGDGRHGTWWLDVASTE